MAHGIVDDQPATDRVNQEYQHQQQHQPTIPTSQEQARREPRELEQQEGTRQQAEALALKLARTYEELTRLLERNPGFKRQFTEGTTKEDRVYQKLKQRLKLADMAPRCQWVRQDGTTCGSPQLKQHIYCFAHRQMAEARTLMLMLPAMEDANAIQIGIMRIQKALIEGTISTKMAGLLLYSMQLALQNVGQTTFGQAKDEEMVRETVDEEEAIRRSGHRDIGSSENQNENKRPFTAKDAEDAKESKQNQHQNQKPLTTKDTKDTEKNQDLLLMNTDYADFGEAGGEDGGGDVEFVPMPGGYGFERVRLRIEPELTSEGRHRRQSHRRGRRRHTSMGSHAYR